MSDVTEDLGQFIESSMLHYWWGEKKKRNLCLQTRPVICGIKVTEMQQEAVCAGSNKANNTKNTLNLFLDTYLKNSLTQLWRIRPVALLISLQLQF